MFGLGPMELIIVLAIVLLVFGSKRIGSLGADLGRAIKGFRKAVKSDKNDEDDSRSERIIDGEAKETDSDTSDKSGKS